MVAKKEKLLDPIHPGEILFEEFLSPMKISMNELARRIGVPPGRISQIIARKRSISADTALRLGKFFGVSPELWLGLQLEYDMRIARRKLGDKLSSILPTQAENISKVS